MRKITCGCFLWLRALMNQTGDYDGSKSLDLAPGRKAVEDATWLVNRCRRPSVLKRRWDANPFIARSEMCWKVISEGF